MAHPSWWKKPRGGAGFVATAGMAVGVAAWWPLAVAAGGSWLALAVHGYHRSARAMRHLATVFPEASRATPYGVLRGKLGDMPFEVRPGVDMLRVLVGTPVPAGITIDRACDGLPIGDPELDARFRVLASDSDCELVWRMMLTADVRARLCALSDRIHITLHDGWFDILIDDAAADGSAIESLIRDAHALGELMWSRVAGLDHLLDAFVAQIAREPAPHIRMNHYQWLVTGGYEVPALLRAAAQDADATIRAWANGQRPPETAYR